MVQERNFVVGQLAVSKRGRDRGEPYLVLEIIDEAFVYLVNGDRRRIENPKRKNVRHLQFYPEVAEHLAQQWEAGRVPIARASCSRAGLISCRETLRYKAPPSFCTLAQSVTVYY